ncbi:hypothetical protein PV08_07702 [Exophiala spinifera]|uniref:Short-chain dehydrogenase n=1 Tax=Exophiala spinifera TaxID=91928 RepID=A0A0D1ZQ45_9EURO|nr:uncharacterized protein PV08_07702 [Exophiala spinifera]KIW14917.1 hypothetical protein PV08_07702 [Exophiala spinifera]
MTATTHTEFDKDTEALSVATAFPEAIKGRTILITGVNKLGIGYTTAEALASKAPKCLILAGRSPSKVQECIDILGAQYPNTDYRLLEVDLSSQASVRTAGSIVMGWSGVPTIDLVINNAGVMNLPQRTLSADGIEMHFATNHLGHFLLSNLVMPKVIAAAEKASSSAPGFVRIINVSSVGTRVSPLRVSDVNFTKPVKELPESEKPNFALLKAAYLPAEEDMVYIPFAAYGQSKTSNVLFSVGLNDRLYDKHGILSLALHPGEMLSELSRHTDKEWLEKISEFRAAQGIDFKSLEAGASTTLVAALDPKLSRPGADGKGYFLSDCRIGNVEPYAVDEGIARKLWELSEDFVGESFTW